MFLYVYSQTTPHWQDVTQGQFLAEFTKSEFRVLFFLTGCLTKAEEPSLLYHLSIAGVRIIGFIFFPRKIVSYEMQLSSSRI